MQRQLVRIGMVAIVGILLWAGGTAQALDPNDYDYNMDIWFSYSGETLNNFPVLIVLDTNKAGFAYSQLEAPANGGDIRFVDGNGTELNYEVEEWNTNGMSYLWVQMPQFEDNPGLVMYWGNSSATEPPASTTNGAVWDSTYRVVHHMNNDPSGASPQILDSTSNDLHSTAFNMEADDQEAGIIGGCLDFDNAWNAAVIEHLTNNLGAVNAPFTVQAWVRFDQLIQGTNDHDYVVFLGTSSGSPTCGSITRLGESDPPAGLDPLRNHLYSFTFDGGDGALWGPLVPGQQWLHVVEVWQSTTPYLSLYVNGARANIEQPPSALSTDGKFFVGVFPSVPLMMAMTGQVDEVRIATAARSPSWVRASYNMENQSPWFIHYGPADQMNPNAFAYRMEIPFTGYDRTEGLANFPALVVLSTNRPGFEYSQFEAPATGGDLRFRDAAGHELFYEIEAWNTNGDSLVWVQVQSLTNANSIWAYWGSPHNTTPPAYTTNGAAWEPNYLAVYHLDDDPSGSAPQVKDSTPNELHCNAVAIPGGALEGAKIGDGLHLDYNSTDYVTGQLVCVSSPYTLESWVNYDRSFLDSENFEYLMMFGMSAGPVCSMARRSGTDRIPDTVLYSWYSANQADGSTVYGGQWVHQCLLADSSSPYLVLYTNGAAMALAPQPGSAIDNNKGRLSMGAFLWDAGGLMGYLDGVMDEVRVASVERSTNWIWATWRNVEANATFNDYQTVEKIKPEGTLFMVR